jgi:hypothetical protein
LLFIPVFFYFFSRIEVFLIISFFSLVVLLFGEHRRVHDNV